MNERENDGFVPCKKFKSTQESNEKIGRNKYYFTPNEAQKEAGSYFLGPVIKKYGRSPVTQCLAKRKGADDCYLMKTLILDDSNATDKCSLSRRSIFHNEYSVLSLLKNCNGVIQVQDFFKDYIMYEGSEEKKNNAVIKRVCMVLECLISHGHHNLELIPLNHYIKEKLSETEALQIFYNLLLVIEDLHKRNIVHRDIKLSNIILNRKTLKVKLIDFHYATLLVSDREFQCTQSRSCEEPPVPGVYPKASDMSSAGIILCAMLYGCMKFTGSFNKNGPLREIYIGIMESDHSMFKNYYVSDGTKDIIKNILCKIPPFRLKASEALDMVSLLLAIRLSSQNPSLNKESYSSDQIVPECPDFDLTEEKDSKPKSPVAQPEDVKPATKSPGKFANTDKEETEKDKDGDHNGNEFEKFSNECSLLKTGNRNEIAHSKDIKRAMMRLGVTSVNSINALSFSYGKKNPCCS